MTLPEPRRSHTLSIVKNKPIICGGTTPTNCIIFTGGQWKVYTNLKTKRFDQSSLVTKDDSIFLIGGFYDSDTTTIIQAGPGDTLPRTNVKGFDLKNDAG